MKEYYINGIIKALQKCSDSELIYLIYSLLNQ